MRGDEKILSRWKLIFEVLAPLVLVVGLYYGLKTDIVASQTQMSERISAVELQSEKSFADKQSLSDIRKDITDIKLDVKEIKTLLKHSD